MNIKEYKYMISMIKPMKGRGRNGWFPVKIEGRDGKLIVEAENLFYTSVQFIVPAKTDNFFTIVNYDELVKLPEIAKLWGVGPDSEIEFALLENDLYFSMKNDKGNTVDHSIESVGLCGLKHCYHDEDGSNTKEIAGYRNPSYFLHALWNICSQEEDRRIMQFIQIKDTNAAATDGFQVGVYDVGSPFEEEILLHYLSAKYVSQKLFGQGARFEVDHPHDRFIMTFTPKDNIILKVISIMIDCNRNFPAWESLNFVKEEEEDKAIDFTFIPEDIEKALVPRISRHLYTKNHRTIVFDLEKQQLIPKADGLNEEESDPHVFIDTMYDGALVERNQKIAFNAYFLKHVLSLPEFKNRDLLTMHMPDIGSHACYDSPVTLRSCQFTYLVMPVIVE